MEGSSAGLSAASPDRACKDLRDFVADGRRIVTIDRRSAIRDRDPKRLISAAKVATCRNIIRGMAMTSGRRVPTARNRGASLQAPWRCRASSPPAPRSPGRSPIDTFNHRAGGGQPQVLVPEPVVERYL